MSRHLMAKMRLHATGDAAGLNFDWRPSERLPNQDWERAELENGHSLAVYPRWGETHPYTGWDWFLWHGEKDEDGNRPVTGGGQGWRDDPNAYSTEHLPTKEHAKAAAEAAYAQLFPLGTNTGPHDSGVDYSDLNRFMGEL